MGSAICNFSSQFSFLVIPNLKKNIMGNLRNKIHRLIEQLNEDELEKTWEVVYTLRCDFQMKKAIQEVMDSQQPWDFLTHEQALQFATDMDRDKGFMAGR